LLVNETRRKKSDTSGQGRVAVVHDLDEHVGFELDGSIDERSLRETWIC
jgi:hypothetical protein